MHPNGRRMTSRGYLAAVPLKLGGSQSGSAILQFRQLSICEAKNPVELARSHNADPLPLPENTFPKEANPSKFCGTEISSTQENSCDLPSAKMMMEWTDASCLLKDECLFYPINLSKLVAPHIADSSDLQCKAAY